MKNSRKEGKIQGKKKKFWKIETEGMQSNCYNFMGNLIF